MDTTASGAALLRCKRDELQRLARRFWNEFEPLSNARVDGMLALMKSGTAARDLFLLDPLVQNTESILDRMAAGHAGAVVVGHKMGGKSQTLHFMEQFCRFVAKEKKTRVFGFKLSFKTEGRVAPPGSYQELFYMFDQHVFAAGVIEACNMLLAAALNHQGLEVPGDPNEFLQLCGQQFHKRKPCASAKVEDVAYMVMWFHSRCVASDTVATKVALEDLQGLVSYGTELFRREEAFPFLNGICMVMFDEVGELLNKDSAITGMAREVAENVLRPLVRQVSEQASGSNLFVLLTGSTSLAEYVVQQHLQKRVYCLSGLSAEECQELWGLWKTCLPDTADVDTAEKWMLDVAAGPEEGSAEGIILGRSLLHHSDGVAGYLVEHFRNAIGECPAPEDTLSFMVEKQYLKLKERLGARERHRSAEVVRDLMCSRKWLDFAQVGLAPSSNIAPSAPVMRELLTLLRQEQGIDAGNKNSDMLRALASRNLTGSFNGAVLQEQVLHALLRGTRIFVTEVVRPTASGGWTFGDTDTFQQPALLVQYKPKDGLSQPLYIGPALADTELANLMQHPEFVVFVPQSQTFPSIDFSVAKIKGVTARLFHCSVSIDGKHFAPSVESKGGHLPLVMDCEPPVWFRSTAAATQVKQYKAALLESRHLKHKEVQHCYAVFDDFATDLLKPTPPFEKTFYRFSERAPSTTEPPKAKKLRHDTAPSLGSSWPRLQ